MSWECPEWAGPQSRKGPQSCATRVYAEIFGIIHIVKRHLIGIGGVGMSALATALLRLGDEVTGADRALDTPNVRFLESLGVHVFPDDGSGVDAARIGRRPWLVHFQVTSSLPSWARAANRPSRQ